MKTTVNTQKLGQYTNLEAAMAAAIGMIPEGLSTDQALVYEAAGNVWMIWSEPDTNIEDLLPAGAKYALISRYGRIIGCGFSKKINFLVCHSGNWVAVDAYGWAIDRQSESPRFIATNKFYSPPRQVTGDNIFTLAGNILSANEIMETP